MPTNNDAQAVVETEVVTPTTAAEVSYGFAVTPQATRLGLTVDVDLATADPLDGFYTVIVETAVTEDPAAGDWVELQFCSVTFNDIGLYPITVVQPIYDKVRARIETDATNPERAQISLRWLSDAELTTLDPTA